MRRLTGCKWFSTVICVSNFFAAQALAANTTEEVYGALTVCGAGAVIIIDSNLSKSISGLFVGEGATGKLTSEVKTQLQDLFTPSNGDSRVLDQYTDCVLKILRPD